ncbi:Zinc finger CCHC domain-containing protein 7 [Nowakowskiella sp. JEL0407]|nr:Zinc finger CCHC domain-containing protein 7 [Nowakowskiella sp. JEL0407]
MLADLPDEVLLRIIQFVPRNAISEFSRSGKLIYNLATPSLFRKLEIDGDREIGFTVKDFCEILDTNASFSSKVTQYTRNFEMQLTESHFKHFTLNFKFERLTSFSLCVYAFPLYYSWSESSLLNYFRSIRTTSSLSYLQDLTIKLDPNRFNSPFPFGELLNEIRLITSLKTLKIASFRMDNDSLLHLTTLLNQNQLTALTFQSVEFDMPLDNLLVAINSCTSLSTLTFHACHESVVEYYFQQSTRLVPNLIIISRYISLFNSTRYLDFPIATEGLRSLSFSRHTSMSDPFFLHILKCLVQCQHLESLNFDLHNRYRCALVDLLLATSSLRNLTLGIDCYMAGNDIESISDALSQTISLENLMIKGSNARPLLDGILSRSDCPHLQIEVRVDLTFQELIHDLEQYQNNVRAKPKRLIIGSRVLDVHFRATTQVDKTPELRMFPRSIIDKKEFVHDVLNHKGEMFERVEIDGFGWMDIQKLGTEYPDYEVRFMDGKCEDEVAALAQLHYINQFSSTLYRFILTNIHSIQLDTQNTLTNTTPGNESADSREESTTDSDFDEEQSTPKKPKIMDKFEISPETPTQRYPITNTETPNTSTNATPVSRYFKEVASPAVVVCNFCRESGHYSRHCPQKEKFCVVCKEEHVPGSNCKLTLVCNQCHELGHWKSECQNRSVVQYCIYCDSNMHHTTLCPSGWRQFRTKQPRKSLRNFSVYCYECSEYGHFGDDCPKSRQYNHTSFNRKNIPPEIRSDFDDYLERW